MFTVTDIKGGLNPVIRKLMKVHVDEAGNPIELTQIELAALIFAFESNIVFNGVANKFVPLLKDIQKQEGPKLDALQNVFMSALQEHVYNDIRIRFGA